MKVEWTCCFCDQKESFTLASDDIDSANPGSDNESESEDEEGYLLCTCCEKQSTWFHANKEKCLQNLLASATTHAKRMEADAVAARVRAAHENVRFEQSRKVDGDSYFFYNCEKCSALECFGCKKASLTREEPHNIGTLRASLCAVCGEKASCSRKYKGKNYTRGVDSDVYLCSRACEKKFGKKTDDDTPANKVVKLNEKQKRRINTAIKVFEEKSIEQFKQRWQRLCKWLKYFEKRDGDDGEEVIIPTSEATRYLTKLIPSDIHFTTLMESEKGKKFSESKTDQEKITRGKLFVSHIIGELKETLASEYKKMEEIKNSEKDLTEDQRTELAMTSQLVKYMDNVCQDLRQATISLEDILVLAENKDAVGIGGNDMLEYYKSKYVAAKDLEASEDKYMNEIKSQIASFEVQRDNLKAATAAIRDSLYKKLRDKILGGADTLDNDDDDDDDDIVRVTKHFSYSVLNMLAWPIVHREIESAAPVCVKVNFWQWAWYNESRALKDPTTENTYLELVKAAVNNILSADEYVQEEFVEDSDAVDNTKVENVEEFKAYFYTLKKTWQEKHFTLRGRDQSKVLTLDAVPLEWLSRADDSDEEMEDAEGSENEEEEDMVMRDADEGEVVEDEVVEDEVSKALKDQTAKHFEICVSALNKRYNTSVVPSNFQWTDPFPTSIPFDEFAMQDASERAKDAIEELVQKVLPKLKECFNAYREAYILLCSGKKDEEKAKYKANKDTLNRQIETSEKKFLKFKGLLQHMKMHNNDVKCYAFVMESDTLFQLTRNYFGSTATINPIEAIKLADTFLATYKSGKKQKKVKGAWISCNQKFEKMKGEYGMEQKSFKNYVSLALISKLEHFSARKKALVKEKEEEKVKYMKFLSEFVDNKAIADAKEAHQSAKEELRNFLCKELDKLYEKYTMYYEGENDNDNIDLWFPMLSRAKKANRERLLMEAEEDNADANLFEYDLRSRVSKWKDSIRYEEDMETNRDFAEEEKRCFKYFKPNSGQAFKSEKVKKKEKALKKEKDNILKAYGRHTMFHHLGQASFVDCGEWAAKLGYEMDRNVFVQWEKRSLKKYMKYYDKKFNPKNAKNSKAQKKLRKYYENKLRELYAAEEGKTIEDAIKDAKKDAEEGRSIALAQIREAAVMRWREQIYKFKDAWKSDNDDKMDECRDALYETFCTTGWMKKVRKNERTTKGLQDTLVDEWSYNDDESPSNRTKQPSIFETGTKKEDNIKPDGLWETYAENDAIFGVKPGDANIKGNPEEYLIEPADDNEGLDVMAATYCPQCGLATFSEFNVYDRPYPGYFPDRNMYPNARMDNKNLQFCGVGDEYETNKKLTDRAKFHFAVHVGLRETYVKKLAKFTTRQFVTLGHTQCETLPNGGCLQAFTRKQAVDGLEDQKEKQARKIHPTSWKNSTENWKKGLQELKTKGLQELKTSELKEKHAAFFRVDVRLPLWQGKKVRAPPGYRLVQYPKKGWTWQLEPFFDPLQTPLLKVEEKRMQWHSQSSNPAFNEALQSLSALCETVGANLKILHNIERFQCEEQGWRARQGIKQFVAGDKPYAWLLPVAPAVNADEDNKLNDVQSDQAKIARAQLKFAKGKVTNEEWVPDAEEALTWYIEDVVSDASLVHRLKLRRDTFLAQQRQVMKLCQTELSRYLIRRKNKKLTSLYKSKTSAFVSEKMDAYSNLSFSHKAYKFNERPNLISAAAPPEEVAAWMTSILTGKPLQMYECERSGKPCIYVESRKNNVTAESIAACAQVSPPEDTMHFVTKQQYDIEADKSVQNNLKRCLDRNVKIFHKVLNPLGREIRQDGFKIGSGDESGSGSESGSESDPDGDVGGDVGGDVAEIIDYSKDKEEAEGVSEEMKQDGWVYYPNLRKYYRKQQGDRSEMVTDQKPLLCKDGKYYAWEEIEQKERELAGGNANGTSGNGGSDGEETSSDEEEMSDLDTGGGKADGGNSDDSDSDGSDSAAAAKAAAEAEAAAKAAAAARSPAEMSVSEVIEQRVPGYIARAATLAAPRDRKAYEPQNGARCAIHAANNFLELEEKDRFTLEHFQELEPPNPPFWDGLGGFAIDTIGKIFETKRETKATRETHEDYCVSLSSLVNLPEEQWNLMRSDPYYLGFIAKPATDAVREEEQDRKEEIRMQVNMDALEITILLKVKDFFTNHLDDFEEDSKDLVKDFMQEAEKVELSRLSNDDIIQNILGLVNLARESVLKGQLQTAITVLTMELQTYRQRSFALSTKEQMRQGNRNEWHWLPIRKYTDNRFFKIDSKGQNITLWDASHANFKRDFSKQKLMIFATPQRAQQWRDELAKSSYSDDSGKRMWALASEAAKDRLKTLFNMSDEESTRLLQSGDEEAESDGEVEGELGKRLRQASSEAAESLGRAAAARPRKKPKPGALFRMLRDMYI